MNRIIKAVSVASALAPALAFAQQYNTVSDVLNRLCTIVGYVFAVLIFLTIVFVIYAAFMYMTAAGDPEKVKKANATILYAAIGLAIAILAKYLPNIVANIMGTSTGSAYQGTPWMGCP